MTDNMVVGNAESQMIGADNEGERHIFKNIILVF